MKRIYRWYATPWEILRQFPGMAGHLKEDMTVNVWKSRRERRATCELLSKCRRPSVSCSRVSSQGEAPSARLSTWSKDPENAIRSGYARLPLVGPGLFQPVRLSTFQDGQIKIYPG